MTPHSVLHNIIDRVLDYVELDIIGNKHELARQGISVKQELPYGLVNFSVLWDLFNRTSLDSQGGKTNIESVDKEQLKHMMNEELFDKPKCLVYYSATSNKYRTIYLLSPHMIATDNMQIIYPLDNGLDKPFQHACLGFNSNIAFSEPVRGLFAVYHWQPSNNLTSTACTTSFTLSKFVNDFHAILYTQLDKEEPEKIIITMLNVNSMKNSWWIEYNVPENELLIYLCIPEDYLPLHKIATHVIKKIDSTYVPKVKEYQNLFMKKGKSFLRETLLKFLNTFKKYDAIFEVASEDFCCKHVRYSKSLPAEIYDICAYSREKKQL